MTGTEGSIADRLGRLIGSRVGSNSVAFAREPVRLGGGFSAETYAFELRDPPPELRRPLVLRIMRQRDDARREIILHRAVARLGFPAPEVHFADDASAEFDRPFLVA